MGDFKLDAKEVGARAAGQWDRVYASLAPSLGAAIARKGRHVACPVHGGTDGFRLHKTSDGGQGICNSCPDFLAGGERKWLDGFGILMWISGRPFKEVLEDVASVVAPELLQKDRRFSRPVIQAVKAPSPPPRTAETIRRDREAVNRMREVWQSGRPISDRSALLAHRYFESRGLPPPCAADGVDSEMRFVPSLRYYHEHEGETYQDHFPAIVALVRNAEGNVRAVHRIYLARDGFGKAPVPAAKKMMGKPDIVSIAGCSVHLGQPGKVVGVAEGIETAWAVRAFTGFTVWPAVNSTLLRQFQPSKGVVGVHIFGDKDRSGDGQDAMQSLQKRLVEHGYSVRADLPPGEIPVGQKSLDWEDLYREFGDRAIWKVQSLSEELRKRTVVPFTVGAGR